MKKPLLKILPNEMPSIENESQIVSESAESLNMFSYQNIMASIEKAKLAYNLNISVDTEPELVATNIEKITKVLRSQSLLLGENEELLAFKYLFLLIAYSAYLQANELSTPEAQQLGISKDLNYYLSLFFAMIKTINIQASIHRELANESVETSNQVDNNLDSDGFEETQQSHRGFDTKSLYSRDAGILKTSQDMFIKLLAGSLVSAVNLVTFVRKKPVQSLWVKNSETEQANFSEFSSFSGSARPDMERFRGFERRTLVLRYPSGIIPPDSTAIKGSKRTTIMEIMIKAREASQRNRKDFLYPNDAYLCAEVLLKLLESNGINLDDNEMFEILKKVKIDIRRNNIKELLRCIASNIGSDDENETLTDLRMTLFLIIRSVYKRVIDVTQVEPEPEFYVSISNKILNILKEAFAKSNKIDEALAHALTANVETSNQATSLLKSPEEAPQPNRFFVADTLYDQTIDTFKDAFKIGFLMSSLCTDLTKMILTKWDEERKAYQSELRRSSCEEEKKNVIPSSFR